MTETHSETTTSSSPKSPFRFAGASAATALLIGLALTLVFLWAPQAQGLGLDFKIFFFHVPAAWIMLLSAIVAGVGSARTLLWDRPDHLAVAAMDLAVLFGIIVLITGPLWAWRAWGKPWVWEPRLTTSLVCWLTYAVALLLRMAGPEGRKTSLLLALLGAFEVPLVYLSVRWWAGGHHPPTSLVPSLSGKYAATLLVSLVGATALWGLLLALALQHQKNSNQLAKLEALARVLTTSGLGLLLLTGYTSKAWAGPAGMAVTRAGTGSTAAAAPKAPQKDHRQRAGQRPTGFVPYRPPAQTQSGPSRGTIVAVLAAYIAFWGVLFFYLVILARKNRNLEERIHALERQLERQRAKPSSASTAVQGADEEKS